MTINRICIVMMVSVVFTTVVTGAQTQGEQQQSRMRSFLSSTINNLVRQYQSGQEAQAQSGMRDLLGDFARGTVSPQLGQGSAAGHERLFADVVNDLTRRYGGQ